MRDGIPGEGLGNVRGLGLSEGSTFGGLGLGDGLMKSSARVQHSFFSAVHPFGFFFSPALYTWIFPAIVSKTQLSQRGSHAASGKPFFFPFFFLFFFFLKKNTEKYGGGENRNN